MTERKGPGSYTPEPSLREEQPARWSARRVAGRVAPGGFWSSAQRAGTRPVQAAQVPARWW